MLEIVNKYERVNVCRVVIRIFGPWNKRYGLFPIMWAPRSYGPADKYLYHNPASFYDVWFN